MMRYELKIFDTRNSKIKLVYIVLLIIFMQNTYLFAEPNSKLKNFPRIMFKASCMWGPIFGEFESLEQDILDNYDNEDSDWDYSKDELDFNLFALGLELDILVFTYKHINFGMKGKFERNYLTQNFVTYQDHFLYSKYSTILIGPEVNIFVVNFTNRLSLFIQSYYLYGKIINGKYSAAEGLRDEQDFDSDEYHAEISKGHVHQLGAGPYMLFDNNFLPIVFGSSLYYSFSKIYFKNTLRAYNKEEITIKNIGINLFVGVYF